MANSNKKKNAARRVPRSATPRTFGDGRPAQPAAPVAEAVEPMTAARPVASAPRSNLGDVRRRIAGQRSETRPQLPLREEYAYVPADLKRLGLLAIGMLVVLGVLGVIVH